MALPLGFVWDQHACLPLRVDAGVEPLERYVQPPGALVSINVGYLPQTRRDVMALLRSFRAAIQANARLHLLDDLDLLAEPAARERVAVVFDLEDSAPLEGNLDVVAEFAALGVRSMIPTYNHTNAAGGGCLDRIDPGLSRWGRDLVAELNRHGMVIDASHCGPRTGLEACEVSTRPVIYSHSCLRSVWEHPRNITDEQARACAATGGVVAISDEYRTGVGIFLGPNTPTIEAMVRHIEAAIDLVGIAHVGVSTDCSFDAADFLAELATNPAAFDDSYTRWGPIRWVQPEAFLTLGAALAERGWADADIHPVLAGNFHRIAAGGWQPA